MDTSSPEMPPFSPALVATLLTFFSLTCVGAYTIFMYIVKEIQKIYPNFNIMLFLAIILFAFLLLSIFSFILTDAIGYGIKSSK